ncbi:hydrocephalus-inducing protein homolog [Strix aluco]|uniref:hydrocephalus-inducing protein homolog n=1 Tax=Strix aluco TaxID=111821 RepID=UPI003DA33E87
MIAATPYCCLHVPRVRSCPLRCWNIIRTRRGCRMSRQSPRLGNQQARTTQSIGRASPAARRPQENWPNRPPPWHRYLCRGARGPKPQRDRRHHPWGTPDREDSDSGCPVQILRRCLLVHGHRGERSHLGQEQLSRAARPGAVHRGCHRAELQGGRGCRSQRRCVPHLQVGTEAKRSLDMSRSSSGDKLSRRSVRSRGQVSAAAGKKTTDGPTPQSQKQHLMDLTGSQGSSSSHHSPLPCVPAQRGLSVSGSTSGELGFRSCVLPEELLVAILSERLQLSDCYQGVVFDGLETPFAHNTASALLCLLKAVRNRPHIYFVNLFQDYASWKAREMAAEEQEGREREEAASREKARLWEMEEDEYDALTEEEKIHFDNSILQVQHERKKREMERLARELEEKQRWELERLREEELLKMLSKWAKRKLGKDKENASRKKSQPGVRQILDDLGLGPSGPPIPPTAFYSVIRHPEKRMVPAAGEALEHFAFVVPEGATAEEGKKETRSLLDVPVVPAVKVSEEQVTPSRGRSGKEKAAGRREAVRQKRSSSRGRRGRQALGTGAPTRPPEAHQSDVDRVPSRGKSVRLSSCQWIVPAHGEVELKVQFSSTVPGQFDQTLHCEVLGTKRLCQVHCRGTCLYPTVSQDPRLVLPCRRKSKADDDIITKQCVMNTGIFHFGPLLCGKSRDWTSPGSAEASWSA